MGSHLRSGQVLQRLEFDTGKLLGLQTASRSLYCKFLLLTQRPFSLINVFDGFGSSRC